MYNTELINKAKQKFIMHDKLISLEMWNLFDLKLELDQISLVILVEKMFLKILDFAIIKSVIFLTYFI